MLKYKRKICTEYTGTLGDTLLVGSNLNSDLQRGYCLGTCSCIGVWFEMNPEKEREGFIPSTHLVGEEEEEEEEEERGGGGGKGGRRRKGGGGGGGGGG